MEIHMYFNRSKCIFLLIKINKPIDQSAKQLIKPFHNNNVIQLVENSEVFPPTPLLLENVS